MPNDTVTKNDLDRFEKRIRFEQRVMDKLEEIKNYMDKNDIKFADVYKKIDKQNVKVHKVETKTQVRSAYISGAVATIIMGGKELLKKIFVGE